MLMKCNICHSEMKPLFKKIILDIYDVQYFICPQCGYLRTESPYWLEEAYASAIARTDVGLICRNMQNSKKLMNICYFLFGKEKKYIDISGGYGILCRMMRDCGFNYFWQDKYCQNLFAQGFEASANDTFSTASLFEVIEHTENPLQFIQSIFSEYKLNNLVFTTNLYTDETLSEDWWYLAPETGQHISFFRKKTLAALAQALHLKFYSVSGMHIFSKNTPSPIMTTLLSKAKLAPFFTMLARKHLKSLLADDYINLRNKMHKESRLGS